MHINLEANDKYSIQAYSEREIQIDSVAYQSSLIISSQEIIKDWPIRAVNELDEESVWPLLRYQPKIIIIGHEKQGHFPSSLIIQTLAKRGVGLESMSIGAACRTFNVLLNEQREVVLGIIL
ncbi:Protein of uncharacterised function (DUF498/DUF598) [Legionella lansingensis]|uniref:Uncharacterized protein n=1 Tax=Legionella lansingensis TaxID=45067 RepID=A0A0W0VTQ3_9GAMM|nr:MTH938/NDUFAF3 family protein [Legionella lansingensis]KTD23455.1 hypothetical protein Llan_0826 [Legionella lansingensis]SNV50854.1 Protein of uncharacterised function (DUF498/DUF598) [Legionella lansingensis]